MYSVILMMAMTTGGESADFGRGCRACTRACDCGCKVKPARGCRRHSCGCATYVTCCAPVVHCPTHCAPVVYSAPAGCAAQATPVATSGHAAVTYSTPVSDVPTMVYSAPVSNGAYVISSTPVITYSAPISSGVVISGGTVVSGSYVSGGYVLAGR